MSDAPEGPGWWYASDGKWYPPDSSPNREGSAVDDPLSGESVADLSAVDETDDDGVVASERERLVRRALDHWVGSLVDLTGRNRLLFFRHTRRGTLDLTPGSALDPDQTAVGSLLAGNRVAFSVLFRDRDHRKEAAARARAISAKAKELLEERGLAALHVTYGMATWDEQKSAAQPAAPVVLLPLELKPQGVAGEDWSLKLAGDPEINPTLLYKLEGSFSCKIDPESLLGSGAEGEFVDLDDVVEGLTKAALRVPEFGVDPSVVVGTFTYHKLPMVKDLQEHLDALVANDLVSAIAGDPGARAAVADRAMDADPAQPDKDPPQDEFLVLDADSSQSRVINTVVAGGDLVVQGPPGTGKSQTIANLIATLAARGNSVLFVAEKRAAVEAVCRRLDTVGLSGLVMDLHGRKLSRRAVAAELRTVFESVRETPEPVVKAIHETLVSSRTSLNDYVQALHEVREPWGLSLHECQVGLSGLSGGARIDYRFDTAQLSALPSGTRSRARDLLGRLADLGGLRPALERPWAHAHLTDVDSGLAARDAARRLLNGSVAAAFASAETAAVEVGLPKATTLAELGSGLVALTGIEQTLAHFRVEVYSQLDLAEVFVGLQSASSFVGRLFSGEYRAARKRLLAFAVDPDAVKDDALAWVESIEGQRAWWTQRTAAGVPVAVPTYLAAVRATWSAIAPDIQVLEAAFPQQEVQTTRRDELDEWLRALDSTADDLSRAVECSEIRAELQKMGLAPFIGRLVTAGVPESVAAEGFDHTWFTSVRDDILIRDRRLSLPSDAHSTTVAAFRSADTAHTKTNPARIRRLVAERIVSALNDHREEGEVARSEARKKSRHKPLRELFRLAPDVLTAVKPCWVMSPLEVSQILPGDRPYFDVVVFDEASQVTPADAVPALVRGRRAVIAGDSRQLPPTAFFDSADDEAAGDEDAEADLPVVDGLAGFDSVLDVLAAFVSDRMLTWHYRSQDERLIAFSNAYIYDHSLTSFPGTGELEGVQSLRVGTPAPGRLTAESVAGEVDLVVERVLEHARNEPDRSLGVIALGIQHANRISDALRLHRLSDPSLESFFEDTERDEPFFVKNLERVQGDERDVIIIALGYGARLPTGQLRHNFGPLNQDGGERRLNVAVTRAKQQLVLVSTFGAQDIDPARSSARGVELLRAYLAYCDSGGRDLGRAAVELPELNPFEMSVRDALQANGLVLVPQHGVSGYRIDFAVAHPDRPGEFALAIECDGASYHKHPTARDRDRLRQEHLERLGWSFHRIWSTDWFNNKEAEVTRAVAAYRDALADRDRAPKDRRPEMTRVEAPVVAPATSRGSKPSFQVGLPIDACDQPTLRRVAEWVRSDGLLRTDEELLEEMMTVLGFRRRGKKIVAALSQAIARTGSS